MTDHSTWREVGARIMADCAALATDTETPGEMTRSYLSPAHHAAAARITQWMRDAGMQVRRDAAGNVIGRYEGLTPGAPAFLTGSHFDTVRNAGIYDGNLGVLLPIACVARWHAQGRRFPFAVEVIGFAEEEGVRFKATLLGSRATAGTFDTRVLDNVDEQGRTMREVIDGAGLQRDGVPLTHADIPAAAYRRENVKSYLEVHIEQGPVLLGKNLPLGIVTAISGATRMMVEIEGVAGHAGTVPMDQRRDAAAAAAEIVLAIERRCGGAPGLVGTVGQLEVPGGATNVVPGRARLSIDIRAGEDALRQAAVVDVRAAIEEIAARRQVRIDTRTTHEAPSVPCAPALQAHLQAAIEACGLPVHHLPSGAGHDAMAIAALTEVAMLFVRCGHGGISHNPLETMTADDAALAAQVFSHFVETLA